MVFQRKRPQDEEKEEGSAAAVDLDDRACPTCREQFPAWVERCPDDGTATVAVEELPPREDPLLERFLAQDDADGPEAGGEAASSA
jgi:hypothetical protein